MSEFFDTHFFEWVFMGAYQVAFALLVAVTVLPFGAVYLHRPYAYVLRRFTLFNLCLFGWSILGDAVWLRLMRNRLHCLTTFLSGPYLLQSKAPCSTLPWVIAVVGSFLMALR